MAANCSQSTWTESLRTGVAVAKLEDLNWIVEDPDNEGTFWTDWVWTSTEGEKNFRPLLMATPKGTWYDTLGEKHEDGLCDTDASLDTLHPT